MHLPSKVDNNTQRKIDVFLKPFNKYFWLLVAIVLVLIFREVFVSLVDKILVAPFLTKVQSNLFNDILFFILSILIGYVIAVINIRDYILAILGLIASYLVIRFSGYWHFKEFSVLASYNLRFGTYIDLLFLASFIGLGINYFRKKKSNNQTTHKKEDSDIGFIADSAITDPKDDKLNRTKFAEVLSKWLQNTVDTNSFRVGIYATYGQGKTSFMNLIKYYLKEESEETIIIDFNPWQLYSSDRFLEVFLEELNTELSKYGSSISSAIKKYFKSIVGNKTFIEKNIHYFLLRSSISNTFKRLDEEIIKTGKKIFVFIDDIDRLDSQEVMAILKLIRNTVNLSNICYIVAYDRDYIKAAIKDFADYNNPNLFLEKFFDIEFVLPNYSKDFIRKEVRRFLCAELNLTEQEMKLTQENIVSFRELNKIKSLLKFNNFFNTQQDKEKLQRLILLKIKYPKLINDLIHNAEDYFEPDNNLWFSQEIPPNKENYYTSDYVKNQKDLNGNDKTVQLNKFMKKLSELGYNEDEQYKIIALLLNIFGYDPQNNLWFLNLMI